MVNILSFHAPLINQLKVARLISAGFLHAFAAAWTSTNTTALRKECSQVHQHLPRLQQPGFPWRWFPTRELFPSDYSITDFLWAASPTLPSLRAPVGQLQHGSCSVGWRRWWRCRKPLTSPVSWQISEGRRSKWQLSGYSPSKVLPQPWQCASTLRGTTSGDEETVQSAASLFCSVFDEVAKKRSISMQELLLLSFSASKARNMHFFFFPQTGKHPTAMNSDIWAENQDLFSQHLYSQCSHKQSSFVCPLKAYWWDQDAIWCPSL